MYRFSHLSLCPLPQCGLDDSKKDHSVIVLSVFPKVGDFNGYVACLLPAPVNMTNGNIHDNRERHKVSNESGPSKNAGGLLFG